jgi:indole-3-glycerol phosphate synthase
VGVNRRDRYAAGSAVRLEALAGAAWRRAARESGVDGAADAARPRGLATTALVGSALMRAADPLQMVHDMLAADEQRMNAGWIKIVA